MNLSDDNFSNLVKLLKEKNFTEVRRWVSSNTDSEPSEIYRKLYDKSIDYLEQPSIPEIVLILGEWGYRNAFAIDREINTMACLTEIMATCRFK